MHAATDKTPVSLADVYRQQADEESRQVGRLQWRIRQLELHNAELVRQVSTLRAQLPAHE